jgi:DNA-binding transcriptional LysR family regulator
MPLNLRQLEVFRLTMQTRNLTEAARLLRVSQPAVSQTLKELEGQLGIPLFVRSGSRISPTGEARMLLPDIERLLAQSGAVEGRANEMRDAGAGSLSIASVSNVAGVILPQVVAAFTRERPRVRLRVNAYVGREDVARQVRQEGADLGFVHAPIDDPSLAIEPIMQGRMVCVLPSTSPLAALADITPAHLSTHAVILAEPTATPGMLLRGRLETLGIRLDRVIETNFSYAAIGLARQGLGIFITDPVILMSGLADGLVIRPFVPDLPVTLAAIYSRHRPIPRLAVRFIAHLRTVLAVMCRTHAPPDSQARVL